RMLGVIPLVMQPCQEQDIPLLWRTLQRYDATRDYASARDGLLHALSLRIATSQQPQVTPPLRPPAPPVPVNAPNLLPPRLAQLGFHAYRSGDTEYIVSPVCDVPAGTFLMGSDPKKDKDWLEYEKPQHSVTLAANRIAKYPVTVAEYACFVHAGQKQPRDWKQQLGALDHPAVYVSWHEATAYATWLAERTGEPWRLPSEAEWEKAARGTDGPIYPWGDKFDFSRCNTVEGYKGGTTPVGSYSTGASPYGAQDMAGNVSEWTSSLFESYPYSQTDGRESPDSTGERVLRGGSWANQAMDARAARRISYRPDLGIFYSIGFGFRLVRAVPS
ncbi:MAG TPA: formylglycine-generating enzyme family protein, partial [Ktedonobacterales bacterium]|nr:formylglycine-generating enzyme family protein [Ktedonobacterales bacterium]